MSVTIGIIANNFRQHGKVRLVEEILRQDHCAKIIPRQACLLLGDTLTGRCQAHQLERIDVVIPRLGEPYFDFGILVQQHFEAMGTPVINSAHTNIVCKNKYLTSLALKKKGLPQPPAAVALSAHQMLHQVRRMDKPVVIKMLGGSEGLGISLIHNAIEAEEWIDTFQEFHAPIYIQGYVDHPGEDYRLLVINGQCVAAMKRIARGKGWKANVALGARVENVIPTPELRELATKATEAVRGDVCGVDMMIGSRGPKIIEVNSFPGFKGLEEATKKNIARLIVQFAKTKARR